MRYIKMPYIISYTCYPPTQSDKVAKRYLEVFKKLPLISSIKRIIPAAVTSTEKGYEVMIVDEVKREDQGDAIDYLAKFLVEFRDIEGFRYKINNWSTLNEAMAYLGM
jgi:hypothetical protein